MSGMPGSDPLKPAGPGVKLTYDDFVLFPDDGKRHELIDGEHYVTPSPNLKHQRVLLNLAFLVRTWLENHPIGEVFIAPFDVVFSRFDVVEPDLLYLSKARAADVLTPSGVSMTDLASRNTGSSIRISTSYGSTGIPVRRSYAPSSSLARRAMC